MSKSTELSQGTINMINNGIDNEVIIKSIENQIAMYERAERTAIKSMEEGKSVKGAYIMIRICLKELNSDLRIMQEKAIKEPTKTETENKMSNERTIEDVKAEIKLVKAERRKAIKSLKQGNRSAFQLIIDLDDELVFLDDELNELEENQELAEVAPAVELEDRIAELEEKLAKSEELRKEAIKANQKKAELSDSTRQDCNVHELVNHIELYMNDHFELNPYTFEKYGLYQVHVHEYDEIDDTYRWIGCFDKNDINELIDQIYTTERMNENRQTQAT